MNAKQFIASIAFDAKFAAACEVFELADNSSVSFAKKLSVLGLGTREDAKPIAMAWAAQKYNEAIVQGQRGAKLAKTNSAAERAMYRVLDVCFPREATVGAKVQAASSQDVVAKLAKQYGKLDAKQRKAFMKAIAAL